MKHLTTLLVALVAFAAAAQQMPYNPDANGDDFVGVDDVLGVLGVYDTALMQPDLQCDYEGTSLEQLFGGLMDESLVLDSVYVEYLYADSVETWDPNCPSPVMTEVVLERSMMLNSIQNYSFQVVATTSYLGWSRSFNLEYNVDNGYFSCSYSDSEQFYLTGYQGTSYMDGNWSYNQNLPFPETWSLTEDGIQIDWTTWQFVHNCQSFRLIPFWHEAE